MAQNIYFHQDQVASGLQSAFEFIWRLRGTFSFREGSPFAIFCLFINLNYLQFAFAWIFIWFSNSQFFNTCKHITFFGVIFFHFVSFWWFAWFRSWGVWYIVYPTCFGIYPTRIINLPFSVLFDSHFFNQPSHPIPLWKKCTSVILSLFQSFIPPYPTQSNFWNYFAVLFDFHFFNHPSHPIPLLKLFCIF